MALDRQDLAFKTLISKEFTTPERQFFQEVTTNTLDVNTTDIIAQQVPTSASQAVSLGIAKYYDKFILTPDLTYPTKVFYFCSGSDFTPGSSTYTASLVQRDFLSDKYGVSYSLELYDTSNTRIYPTDDINWFFNYKTGILNISNPESGSYATPYKISIYQYIGTNLSQSLGSIESQIQGIDSSRIFSGSFTASVSPDLPFSVREGGIDLLTVDLQGHVEANAFTGSFSGSGADLYDIPATAIQGLNLSQIATGSISASLDATTETFRVISSSVDLLVVDSGSGVTAISFSGSFSGSGADLYDIPASGIVGLNLSQIADQTVSASIDTGSISFNIVSGSDTLITVYNTGLVSASIFSGSFVGTGSNLVDLRIGTPSDGGFDTGFFDTFTSGTKLSDAIDEISAAFLDLAPPQGSRLTGTNLTRNTPSVFTAYLAGGLNADDWYVNGGSANSSLAGITAATNANLGTVSFRIGKASSILAGLVGGVTASIGTGSQTPIPFSTRALSSGNGTTGNITVSNIGVYNTFWATASAAIGYTIAKTGSVRFNVSADNGAGTSNTSTLFYAGDATDFPQHTITTQAVTVTGKTYNSLSGIQYLKTANFNIAFTGSNLYNPVYYLNQTSVTSDYFATITTGSNTPQYNDTLGLEVSAPLLSNKTSYNAGSITGQIQLRKPEKTNVNSIVTLTTEKVNSYTSPPSTNTIEYFLDESKRYSSFTVQSWDSTTTLQNGDLQVQNGRLVHGQYGGDYPAFAGDQQYLRVVVPSNPSSFTGSFNFNTAGFTNIAPWGSTGTNQLQVAFVVNTAGSYTGGIPNTVYDLGKAAGTSATVGGVNVIGVKTGTAGQLSGAIDMGTSNTGTSTVIVWVKFVGINSPSYYINQFSFSLRT